MKDCLDRVAMDGSEKFRVQGRAVITEGLAADRTVRGFALRRRVGALSEEERGAGEKVRDASAGAVSAPWASPEGGGLEAFLDIEEVFGVLAHHEGGEPRSGASTRTSRRRGLEASLLGCIFGIGHNSNGDLAAVGAAAERVSGTFILDETCVAPEQRADNDEAIAFVPPRREAEHFLRGVITRPPSTGRTTAGGAESARTVLPRARIVPQTDERTKSLLAAG